MESVRLEDATDALAAALMEILTEGGDGNELQVAVGDVRLRFAARRGDPFVRCEATSSKYLARHLDAEAERRFADAGFSLPMDGGNYERLTEIRGDASLRELVETTLALLRDAYACRADETVQLTVSLERAEHPTNPELLSILESGSDPETLRFALLNARFLVPMDGKEIRFMRDAGGRAVVPAFTDIAAFRRADPNGVEYEAITGQQLFPWMRRRDLAMLVINPAGPAPTPLDRARIAVLADAVALA